MKEIFENEMKLEFASKSNNEAFARICVAAFVAGLDPTIEEISDIKTSVSEAVTNCIVHGYENTDGIIKIVFNIDIFVNFLEGKYTKNLQWIFLKIFRLKYNSNLLNIRF